MAGLDLILDEDQGGELLLRGGDFVLGVSVTQNVRIRLRTYLEEYFLDQSVGTAWVQVIFDKPFNAELAESHLRDRILGTEGVSSIQSLTLTPNTSNRTLSVVYRFTQNTGDVAEGVEVFS